MTYINIKTQYGVETVDEFKTRKEAIAMRKEYQLSDSSNNFYTSSRCTKDWRNK